VHLVDEVLQHLLGVGEVGDDAVLHGPDRSDVAGGAAEHVLRFDTDGDDDLAAPRRFVLDSHHGGLVQHDALAADIDQGVGRSQVDGKVAGEVPAEAFEHEVLGNLRPENMLDRSAGVI
jgi:hypothetical protein